MNSDLKPRISCHLQPSSRNNSCLVFTKRKKMVDCSSHTERRVSPLILSSRSPSAILLFLFLYRPVLFLYIRRVSTKGNWMNRSREREKKEPSSGENAAHWGRAHCLNALYVLCIYTISSLNLMSLTFSSRFNSSCWKT